MTDDAPAARLQRILKRAALQGFAGHCAAAAIAIARTISSPDAQIVGAFNAVFHAHGYPMGHIAVLWRGHYWDSDADPKDWDDIACWGMLDVEDLDHQELAAERGIAWTDAAAETVVRLVLTEAEAIATGFDTDHLAQFCEKLRVAAITDDQRTHHGARPT